MRAFGSGRSRGRRSSTAIRSQLVLAVLAVLGLYAIIGSAPAIAGIDHELAVFSDCPTSVPGVDGCAYSTIPGGEFKLGSKKTPIVHTITLQGGLQEGTNELVPAADGNTLSKTPQTIPGGLVGLGVPGEEVTATAELAGPVFLNSTALLRGGPSVQLPLKVKLDNVLLGSTCYVGTEAEPISLTLTTGTTSPPPPNTPISGKTGTLSFGAAGNLVRVSGTVVVDNEFAAPGASGCGPLGLEDLVVNNAAGLPSAAGNNSVVQETEFLQANPGKLKNQAILPAIGRCVKAAVKHTGEFESAKCVAAAPGEGNFEWQEGPGANSKFTSSGGVLALEGLAGAKVACKKSKGTGQYTGAKSLTATLTLTGCTLASSKASCQSSGAASGEIVSSALAGQLGFIKDQSGPSDELLVSVGVDLSHGPSLIAAQCAGLSEPVTVTGSVIGALGKLSTMSKTNTLTATQSAGKQSPEAFEEQPKDTLTATLGSGAEQAGLASKVTITNEEKLEVKAAQE